MAALSSAPPESTDLWYLYCNIYGCQKKGQATQEGYKEVVRLCREEIRRLKAQLNLAAAIKGNEKCFHKNINRKRRAKNGRETMIRMRKRLMYSNAFFASVFNSKINCFQGTQHLVLEETTEEQNEAP